MCDFVGMLIGDFKPKIPSGVKVFRNLGLPRFKFTSYFVENIGCGVMLLKFDLLFSCPLKF